MHKECKYIIVGDLHISPFNYKEILDYLETLRKKELPIIQLGDFFDTRYLPPEFITEIENYFHNNSFKEFTVLVGNHDIIHSNASLVDLLKPYVRVIDKPTTEMICGKKVIYFPYMKRQEFIERHEEFDLRADYMFTHLDLIDHNHDIIIPREFFRVSREIFNGHIHSPYFYLDNYTNERNSNLANIGSVYPTRYNEKDDIKRIVYLDFKTDKWEFDNCNIFEMVEINKFNPEYNTPRHIIYFTGNMEDFYKYNNVKKKVVRHIKQDIVNESEDTDGNDSLRDIIYKQLLKYVKDNNINLNVFTTLLNPKVQKFLEIPVEDFITKINEKCKEITNG